MKKISLPTLLLLFPITTLFAQLPIEELDSYTPAWKNYSFDEFSEPKHIQINNRILTKINGNPISVLDVMRKMDMIFFKEFPQYADSEEARFQFYSANWEHFFNELINNELIYSDAKEKNMPLSDSDIRAEMEALFGPNVVLNIDKMGMTFQDVWQILERDLYVRRMIYFRVTSKVKDEVTPERLKLAYQEFSQKNRRPSEWHYQLLTLRGPNIEKNKELAAQAYDLLSNQQLSLEDIEDKLLQIDPETKVSISEEFHRSEKDIAKSHLEALENLQEGEFSQPLQQVLRSDQSTVYRIYVLNKFIEGGTPSFKEVQDQLQDELVGKAIEKNSNQYLSNLRKKYGIDDKFISQSIPENFQPFYYQ